MNVKTLMSSHQWQSGKEPRAEALKTKQKCNWGAKNPTVPMYYYFLLPLFFPSYRSTSRLSYQVSWSYFTDGEPLKLPESLESLPKSDHFPNQRHRWNTNEVGNIAYRITGCPEQNSYGQNIVLTLHSLIKQDRVWARCSKSDHFSNQRHRCNTNEVGKTAYKIKTACKIKTSCYTLIV